MKASATGGRGPSFDTVLSEGDRNTLALAVFAAMMFERPDRAECVVVLDDPFISLDRNRRGRTCELVQQLHDRTAQVIVLSHDEYFLRDVLECVTSAVGPVQHKLDPTGRAGTLLNWDADIAGVVPSVVEI